MPTATRVIEIDAPTSVVMGVITDFPRYPDFLPEIERADVLRHQPGEWEVAFAVRVVRSLPYTLRLVQEGPLHLHWSLVEGVFRANDGSWRLASLDGGRRTRAEYRLDVQIGMFVPGNLVRNLVDHQLPDTLRRFSEESERRARAG